MQALPTSSDFDSPEEKIETGGGAIGATRSSVKEPGRVREAQYEGGRDSSLRQYLLTKLPFRRGIEIVRQVAAPEFIAQYFQTVWNAQQGTPAGRGASPSRAF